MLLRLLLGRRKQQRVSSDCSRPSIKDSDGGCGYRSAEPHSDHYNKSLVRVLIHLSRCYICQDQPPTVATGVAQTVPYPLRRGTASRRYGCVSD